MTKKALADRIRRELRRNACDHCFIHARELDEIWPDWIARQIDLYRVAEENGFVLAWCDEHIGVIFIEPGARAPVRRMYPEEPASRRSRPPPTTI